MKSTEKLNWYDQAMGWETCGDCSLIAENILEKWAIQATGYCEKCQDEHLDNYAVQKWREEDEI